MSRTLRRSAKGSLTFGTFVEVVGNAAQSDNSTELEKKSRDQKNASVRSENDMQEQRVRKFQVCEAVPTQRSFKTEKGKENRRACFQPVVPIAALTPLTKFRGMAPNDLGLLSEVATALDPQLVDTSLIDPSLLDPPLASSSTSSHSIPQHSNQFNHSDQYGDISVGARSGAGEFQVGSSNGALSSVGMQIDPSLQSLSNEFNLDSMFNGLYRAESRHSQQDSDEEEEEDYSNSSSQEDEVEYQLEQTPRDVNEQILQLRDMDVEAERGLEKNSAYQKELTNLMARFQAASKRTTELKVRVSLSRISPVQCWFDGCTSYRHSSRVCRQNCWQVQI